MSKEFWTKFSFDLGNMAAPKLQPFKAKAEERAKLPSDGDEAAPVAKKQCSAYEKQFQAMEGDTTLIKDC